jgi:hypothetical protein
LSFLDAVKGTQSTCNDSIPPASDRPAPFQSPRHLFRFRHLCASPKRAEGHHGFCPAPARSASADRPRRSSESTEKKQSGLSFSVCSSGACTTIAVIGSEMVAAQSAAGRLLLGLEGRILPDAPGFRLAPARRPRRGRDSCHLHLHQKSSTTKLLNGCFQRRPLVPSPARAACLFFRPISSVGCHISGECLRWKSYHSHARLGFPFSPVVALGLRDPSSRAARFYWIH